VTTVSRWLAERAQSIAPFARPIVAPMPVNIELFQPSASGHTTDEVLFVGRLNEQKGLHVLLDVLAMMRRRARLQVVGDGPYEHVLKRQAAELGIAERITWHGSLKRDGLLALYQRAAAVAIPSRDEGLGLVAVESQLCETPVVAFDSGGLPDVIVNGQTGLLTPAGDSGAMAAALDTLLADASLARSLGAAGRRAALAVFSPAAAAARYAEIYRGLGRAAA
jgi:glycosyltransferase involved in cell wall biosynthesis